MEEIFNASEQYHRINKDCPVSISLDGVQFNVAVIATMWFFDRGGGWTCASVEFAKKIEEILR